MKRRGQKRCCQLCQFLLRLSYVNQVTDFAPCCIHDVRCSACTTGCNFHFLSRFRIPQNLFVVDQFADRTTSAGLSRTTFFLWWLDVVFDDLASHSFRSSESYHWRLIPAKSHVTHQVAKFSPKFPENCTKIKIKWQNTWRSRTFIPAELSTKRV